MFKVPPRSFAEDLTRGVTTLGLIARAASLGSLTNVYGLLKSGRTELIPGVVDSTWVVHAPTGVAVAGVYLAGVVAVDLYRWGTPPGVAHRVARTVANLTAAAGVAGWVQSVLGYDRAVLVNWGVARLVNLDVVDHHRATAIAAFDRGAPPGESARSARAALVDYLTTVRVVELGPTGAVHEALARAARVVAPVGPPPGWSDWVGHHAGYLIGAAGVVALGVGVGVGWYLTGRGGPTSDDLNELTQQAVELDFKIVKSIADVTKLKAQVKDLMGAVIHMDGVDTTLNAAFVQLEKKHNSMVTQVLALSQRVGIPWL